MEPFKDQITPKAYGSFLTERAGPLTDNLRQRGGLQVQHDVALLDARFELHQAVQGQRGHMGLAPALAALLHLLLKLDPSG